MLPSCYCKPCLSAMRGKWFIFPKGVSSLKSNSVSVISISSRSMRPAFQLLTLLSAIDSAPGMYGHWSGVDKTLFTRFFELMDGMGIKKPL